jgi:hypothetical protein
VDTTVRIFVGILTMHVKLKVILKNALKIDIRHSEIKNQWE